MAGKFELKTAKNGQFMFNLKAGNGEIILTSEMYKAKASAVNGIESVKKNAAEDKRFDAKKSENGKWYFVLKAGNGEIIGKSQMYAAEDSCKNGIESVKKSAPTATVDDNS